MKKNLLLLLGFLLAASFKTFATHDIGGEISYQCVAPNSYLVTYSHYNWNGNNMNLTLALKSPGCNVGRTIPMQYQGSRIGETIPNYAGFMDYKIATYTANVTFSAAEQTCKDWVFRVSSFLGQQSANMTTSFVINTEATLKLGNNINNSSPVFDQLNLPILLATKFQLNNLSVAAYDMDGDSLSYESVAPFDDNFQPRTNYNPTPWPAAQIFANPNPPAPYCNVCPNGVPNPQFGVNVTIPAIYSPAFPLPSISANWNAVNPATGIPFQIVSAYKVFELDSLTGALSIIPIRYDSVFVGNYYMVSFKISEFRKVNGVTTKIGSVRRETLIIVGDGGSNVVPTRAVVTFNNQPLQPGTEIRLQPGTPLNLQYIGADANGSDILTIKSNAPTVLPGGTYVVSTSSRPTGIVTWTPTAAHVRSQPYYISFVVNDNASPVHGTHVETIAVRVSNTGGIAGLSSATADLGFKVYPNPFSESVNFKFNSSKPAKEIRIYNLLGQQIDVVKVSGTENDIRWEKAAGFASGTYVAKLITTDNTIQTLKFSKLQ